MIIENEIEIQPNDFWFSHIISLPPSILPRYIAAIESGDEITLIAASFILWGPLVIGGGAAIMPKVKKAFSVQCSVFSIQYSVLTMTVTVLTMTITV